jgi:cold shock CspA family protein
MTKEVPKMQRPLKITARDFVLTEAVERQIWEKVAGLESYFDRINDEIYFHRNSVLPPGFESLKIGTEVRFVQEMGECGPQASSLSIIHPRHERRGT